jgi:hypothetical protein
LLLLIFLDRALNLCHDPPTCLQLLPIGLGLQVHSAHQLVCLVPRLLLNWDLPDNCFLSSWDYRCQSLHQAKKIT